MVSETESTPPRRTSDAPSARGLTPRRVSAVRRFPPLCGRLSSPPPNTIPVPLSDTNVNQPSLEQGQELPVVEKGDEPDPNLAQDVSIKKRDAPPSMNLEATQVVTDAIPESQETAIVPFQSCHTEDAALNNANDSRPTSPLQKRRRVCARKTVGCVLRPRLTLKHGPAKKKGSRVARKKVGSGARQLNVMTLTLPTVTPSEGEMPTNARGKVKKILRQFHMVCRMLIQKEESGGGSVQGQQEVCLPKLKGGNRIDLTAFEIVKGSSEYVKPGEDVVGHVPGVEVGDEYRYRVELNLVGLHRPPQGGIAWTNVNGVQVASSIVASGGYSDGIDSSGVLIYTGSGGKPTGKKGKMTLPQDQKLEGGNLALKNSLDMKTPVRVIYGHNISATSKKLMTFTYYGLYVVEEFNEEPQKYEVDGSEYTANVFKYKLIRMPGQPEVGLLIANNFEIREGLCVPDISQGKEKIPISAINTVDDEKPSTFKYITSMIYPSWYEKVIPKGGCECTGTCSSKKCACALKNGGEMPYNSDGAIVHAKPVIFECGPACRCPPSCNNRVSQRGIRIPLEIFKTETRGWGVRCLSSIPSGSFVCEYVGELLKEEEAESRKHNDVYLFDIGHNYDDAALWEGLAGFVPSTEPDSEASASEGFTIDAAEMGNVGRFINHSCSPNLYAQDVMFDLDDRRMPHVMLFAAETIPRLQELTYHYNYTIGQVCDSQGNEVVKECYCGSLECRGRLY